MPSPRFLREVRREEVRTDIRTLADLSQIYCRGRHGDRARSLLASDAAAADVYGEHPPVLCAECAEHLRYGEARRVFCPMDPDVTGGVNTTGEPKPFCAHCPVHCYKPDERAWSRQMMRYAGPRSVLQGHLGGGIRHATATLRTALRALVRHAG